MRVKFGRILFFLVLFAAIASATGLPAATVEGQSTTASPPSAGGITYLGKPQTAEWLDAQYKEFGKKMILVDGKFYPIPPLGTTDYHEVGYNEVQEIGEVRRVASGSQVLQVIDQDSVLVNRPGIAGRHAANGAPVSFAVPELIYHVRGIDTKTLVDGVRFKAGRLMFVGTYRYKDTLGAKRTVASFVSLEGLEPITREQFANAMAGGFVLPGTPIDPNQAARVRQAQAAVDELTTQLKKFDADSSKMADFIKLQADIARWQPLATQEEANGVSDGQYTAKVAAIKEQLKSLGNITQTDVDGFKEKRAKLTASLEEAQKALQAAGGQIPIPVSTAAPATKAQPASLGMKLRDILDRYPMMVKKDDTRAQRELHEKEFIEWVNTNCSGKDIIFETKLDNISIKKITTETPSGHTNGQGKGAIGAGGPTPTTKTVKSVVVVSCVDASRTYNFTTDIPVTEAANIDKGSPAILHLRIIKAEFKKDIPVIAFVGVATPTNHIDIEEKIILCLPDQVHVTLQK